MKYVPSTIARAMPTGALPMLAGSLATLILCMGRSPSAPDTLMFEGVPTYPAGAAFWQVIAKHQVNLFFTAPTAIRALHGLRR